MMKRPVRTRIKEHIPRLGEAVQVLESGMRGVAVEIVHARGLHRDPYRARAFVLVAPSVVAAMLVHDEVRSAAGPHSVSWASAERNPLD